jgi:hypothetical protein
MGTLPAHTRSAKVWLVAVLLGLAALPVSASALTQAASPRIEPTPAPQVPRIPPELVGTWQRRDAYLIVVESGAARFRWRTQWCALGQTGPCDSLVGDRLAIGAHAEIGFSGPDPKGDQRTILGRVATVEPADLFVVGPVTVVQIASDLIELQQTPRSIELCRPPRELSSCDELL